MASVKDQQQRQQNFSKNLLAWYDKNKRDLPWRHTRDPYAIWVSEAMLQQTTVDTVIPYYHAFLKKFPNWASLAMASEDELLKSWQGLGYYTRVRNLQKSAQLIQTSFNGKTPSTQQELLKMPGLGPYASAAVASIAFGEPVSVLDGNVMRVLTRFNNDESDISDTSSKNKLSVMAQKFMPSHRPGDYNQAVMELGALVCRPKNADCGFCPLQTDCLAFQMKTVERLPVKSKKIRYVKEGLISVMVEWKGSFALVKRSEDQIMKGMWEFPQMILNKDILPDNGLPLLFLRKMVESFDGKAQALPKIRHAIMNRRIELSPYHIACRARPSLANWGKTQWFSWEELEKLPLTTLSHKAMEVFKNSHRQ